MSEVEISIMVTWPQGDAAGAMCILLAHRPLPFCPRKGELLEFYQSKGSDFKFNLPATADAEGGFPSLPGYPAVVSVTVDQVQHYSIEEGGSYRLGTTLRCNEIAAASKEDARAMVTFLTSQAGFAVLPHSDSLD
jgi:hypothetical protein